MSLRCLALAVVCCWAAAVNAGHGKIVAVPHGSEVPDGAVPMPAGMRMPAKAVADATRRARKSGRSVSIDVPEHALPSVASASQSSSLASTTSLGHTLDKKESHKQKMASATDAQIGDDADEITGDGARKSRQPVDEVSKLIKMLPYAFCGVTVAVICVICIMGRISKYAQTDSSYFENGTMKEHKSAAKGGAKSGGGVGYRRY